MRETRAHGSPASRFAMETRNEGKPRWQNPHGYGSILPILPFSRVPCWVPIFDPHPHKATTRVYFVCLTSLSDVNELKVESSTLASALKRNPAGVLCPGGSGKQRSLFLPDPSLQYR